MKTRNIKFLVMLIACMAYSNLMANDTIRFTWAAKPLGTAFAIEVPIGELLMVDWGDGTSDTITGGTNTILGSPTLMNVIHTYDSTKYWNRYTATIIGLTNDCTITYLWLFAGWIESLDVSKCKSLEVLDMLCTYLTELDVSKNTALRYLRCWSNYLTELDVSKNTALEHLDCSDNQLTTLDLSTNIALEKVYCYDNQLTALIPNENAKYELFSCHRNSLLLSDIYKISKLQDGGNYIAFSPQELSLQVAVNSPIDFSAQTEFDGVETEFTVEPDNDYYTVNEGIVTFYKKGKYKVTMINRGMTSYFDSLAEVVVNFEVTEVGVVETHCNASLRVYPNPTIGQLTIACRDGARPVPTVEIYSVVGQMVGAYPCGRPETTIDISHLANGMYFLKFGNKTVRFVKE